MTSTLRIQSAGRSMVTMRTIWLTISVALFIGIVAITDGPSLHFSFLLDDCDAILSVLRTPYRDLFLTRHDGGYYRPLTFALFKAVADLTSSTPTAGVSPVPYHALALSLHTLNGVLLTLLAERWIGRWPATLAGILFLVFPFSYQAVEIVGATAHLLATAAIFLMLLCWFGSQKTRGPVRIALCAGATLAGASAPGFHETGLLALPLLLAARLFGADPGQRPPRRLQWYTEQLGLPWSAFVAGAHALYIVLWVLLPSGRPLRLSDTLPNFAFWLQAVTFPVTRLLAFVPLPASVTPLLLVSVTGALTLVIALALAWAGGMGRLSALAVACSAAAFTPSALSLSAAYVANGPRLLYTAAPGIAVFWAALFPASACFPRGRRLVQIMLFALVLLAIFQSVSFLRIRTDMGRIGREDQEEIVAFVAEHPGVPVAVVDAPTYFLPRNPEFLLGNLMHHAQAHFHGFDKLIAVRSGLDQQRPVVTLVDRSDDHDWPYRVAYHGQATSAAELAALQRTGWAIAVVQYRDGHVRVEELPLPRTAVFDRLHRAADQDVSNRSGA